MKVIDSIISDWIPRQDEFDDFLDFLGSRLDSWIDSGSRTETEARADLANLIIDGLNDRVEILDLSAFSSLTSLPPEIGCLDSLKDLSLEGCTSLTSLPPEIGCLDRLKDLSLKDCTSLTSLPPEIGCLDRLKDLDLQGCTSLTRLPPEILKLKNLHYLDLDECGFLLQPIKTISLSDLYPVEYKEFIATLESFFEIFQRLEILRLYGQDERILTKGGSSQAAGRFVSAFKEGIVAKRLAYMEQEHLKVNAATVSLWEDPSVTELEKSDERGPALPLTVLECFLAEDARVRCLRLQQEREDGLS